VNRADLVRLADEQLAKVPDTIGGLDTSTFAAGIAAILGLSALAWTLVRRRAPAPPVVTRLPDAAPGVPVIAQAPPGATTVPSIVRDEVRSTWADWSKNFEGRTPTMYQDVKGLITTGIGNLIDPMSMALGLPWLKPDGTPATQEEIEAEWHRVKSMSAGQYWTKYRTSNELHLSDEAIDALVLKQLDANAIVLQRYFPDFAVLPAGAQRAILSIAWAVGAGFPPKWPNFTAAIRAHDYVKAADNSSINTTGNAGVAPRNAANKAALLEAASSEAVA
jgi:GH24 family phage-related lysozyme (muramidase)